MRTFKFVGAMLLIIALVFALFLVGRIETEDRLFRSGRLEKTDRLSDAEIVRWLGTTGLIALGGGLMFLIYFLTDTAHIDKLFEEDDGPDEIIVPPLAYSLPTSQYVDMSSVQLLDDVEIQSYPYKIYKTEDNRFVITSVSGSIQYWIGTWNQLVQLEADLDE